MGAWSLAVLVVSACMVIAAIYWVKLCFFTGEIRDDRRGRFWCAGVLLILAGISGANTILWVMGMSPTTYGGCVDFLMLFVGLALLNSSVDRSESPRQVPHDPGE